MKLIIAEENLLESITDFIDGLFKVAKVTHAGNCLAVSEVLKEWLLLFNIHTLVTNVKVKQGRRRVNHYYLTRVSDGIIIDATASQFIYPNKTQMPKVFIGKKPDFYLTHP